MFKTPIYIAADATAGPNASGYDGGNLPEAKEGGGLGKNGLGTSTNQRWMSRPSRLGRRYYLSDNSTLILASSADRENRSTAAVSFESDARHERPCSSSCLTPRSPVSPGLTLPLGIKHFNEIVICCASIVMMTFMFKDTQQRTPKLGSRVAQHVVISSLPISSR
jgi:hypothetical protein